MWPGCTRSLTLASLATAACTVGGRNAGGHAFRGLNGNGEGGGVLGAVACGHGRQLQEFAALTGQGQADQAAAKAGHEIDGLGCDMVCCQYQVTFVFTVFFIDQDDHAAGTHIGNDVFNGRNGSGHVQGFLAVLLWVSPSMRST
jgi:hypothetical protein